MVLFAPFATLVTFAASSLAAALPFREPVLVSRAASGQAAPHWVAYQDAWVSGENGPPSPDTINGFNTFLLSFWTPTAPVDQAAEWVSLDAATRSSIKSAYEAAGIKLMVSAFGDQVTPTTSKLNPNTTADQVASFVKQYTLDGVDVDYEDFAAVNAMDGSAETWLIQFTTELRKQLPAPQYIITHAPVGPWFNAVHYKSGAYVTVNTAVGNLIDWYNVQFYNQGIDYETCSTLFTRAYSSTAVLQINATGVPLDKIVIGKPALVNSAGNGGFMNTTTLASCLSTAKAQGWNAGVMVWQYPDGNAAWIEAVRAESFPVSADCQRPVRTFTTPPHPPATSTGTASSSSSSARSSAPKTTSTSSKPASSSASKPASSSSSASKPASSSASKPASSSASKPASSSASKPASSSASKPASSSASKPSSSSASRPVSASASASSSAIRPASTSPSPTSTSTRAPTPHSTTTAPRAPTTTATSSASASSSRA